MQYFCKNTACDWIFLDEDLRGRTMPEKWKYCPQCVERYGFNNPDKPPEIERSEEQLKVLKDNAFHKGFNRKNFERKK